MSRKPLIETNPYLRSTDEYLKSLVTNVASSTAIETGETTVSLIRSLMESEIYLELLSAEKKTKKSSE